MMTKPALAYLHWKQEWTPQSLWTNSQPYLSLMRHTTQPSNKKKISIDQPSQEGPKMENSTNNTNKLSFLDTLKSSINTSSPCSQVVVQQNLGTYEPEDETDNYLDPDFFIPITSLD